MLWRGVYSAGSVCYMKLTASRQGVIPEKWRPIYDILINIRNELDKLSLTQAWSLRETDLYDYQRQLDKIDEARVDGNWLDDQGRPAEPHIHKVSHRKRLYDAR